MMHLLAMVLALLSCVLASAAGPIQWQEMNEPGCGGWVTAVRVSPHEPTRILAGGDCLGAALSTDAGESWSGTFGFASWEINDFTWHPQDPQTVWAGTLSGPYVSHDGGRTFIEKRKGMPTVAAHEFSAPVERVLFDPSDSRRLIAVGGSNRRWDNTQQHGFVWESRDGGENWVQLTRIMRADGKTGGNIVGAELAAGSSQRIYAIVDQMGVYVSEDGGRTFEARNDGLPARSVNRLAAHPSDPDRLYITLGSYSLDRQWRPGGVYMSRDAGRSWEPRNSGLSQHQLKENSAMFSANLYGISISRTQPDVLVASDASWTGAKMYKSVDGGENWSVICESGSAERAMRAGMHLTCVAISPTDAKAIYGAGSEFIVGSKDGGESWTDLTALRPDPARPDAWRGRGFEGWCTTDFAFNPANPRESILLAMDAAKGWLSVDDLRSWTYHGLKPTPWGGGTAVVWAGDSIYATLGQSGDFIGLNVSHDGGKTWKLLPAGENGLTARRNAGGVWASSKEPRRVWAAADGKLFRSDDGGEKWQQVEGLAGVNWLAGRLDGEELYARGDAGVWRLSPDAKPELIGGPKPSNQGRMAVDSLGRVYVCHWRAKEDGGLWRYAEGKWEKLRDDPFIMVVAADPNDPRRLMLGTSDHPYHDHASVSGIWVSADDGVTWEQANDGLAMLRISVVAFDPGKSGRVVAGTGGRGFYVGTWKR